MKDRIKAWVIAVMLKFTGDRYWYSDVVGFSPNYGSCGCGYQVWHTCNEKAEKMNVFLRAVKRRLK